MSDKNYQKAKELYFASCEKSEYKNATEKSPSCSAKECFLGSKNECFNSGLYCQKNSDFEISNYFYQMGCGLGDAKVA